MFGDLMGDMQAKQAEMKAAMADIEITTDVADGAIEITANANREILNINIDDSKLDLSDKEQLEDLLVVAINQVLEDAAAIEAEEGQKLIQQMLPPGLGGMFG